MNTLIINQSPEKLSGHDLVNYLISNPNAKGKFRWRTLRSCMWRNLLIAVPEFVKLTDFEKINTKDIFKILNIHPHLKPNFDWQKIGLNDQLKLLTKYPELAINETTSEFTGYCWGKLLKKHPHLQHLCQRHKLNMEEWCKMLCYTDVLAWCCPWHRFDIYCWKRLLIKNKSYLKYLRLEYLRDEGELRELLFCTYFGNIPKHQGIFKDEKIDAATFLIYKQLDRKNAKEYLKYLYCYCFYYVSSFRDYNMEDWIAYGKLIDQLCELSPKDAMDIPGKKYLQFYLALFGDDTIFKTLFPHFDLKLRDPAGNSLLLMTAMRYSPKNYKFLLKQGLDPNEKNLAGFSCQDFFDMNIKKEVKKWTILNKS